MSEPSAAAVALQKSCYARHPFLAPADAVCVECLTLALGAERARVWEEAANICQQGSNEPMTGDDEQVRFGQAGVKLALGVLAIAFRARATTEGK